MDRLIAAARKLAASYAGPKLKSDNAIVTVLNGDLRELNEALAALDHERGSAIEGDFETQGGGGFPA